MNMLIFIDMNMLIFIDTVIFLDLVGFIALVKECGEVHLLFYTQFKV